MREFSNSYTNTKFLQLLLLWSHEKAPSTVISIFNKIKGEKMFFLSRQNYSKPNSAGFVSPDTKGCNALLQSVVQKFIF